MDTNEAQKKAGELIDAEKAGQDRMWGATRDDNSHGEMLRAAMATCDAVQWRRDGQTEAFEEIPAIYPENWSGFRSYGADVPNLVVAAAFLRSEIERLLRAGEDFTRVARRSDQPYAPDMKPNA